MIALNMNVNICGFTMHHSTHEIGS